MSTMRNVTVWLIRNTRNFDKSTICQRTIIHMTDKQNTLDLMKPLFDEIYQESPTEWAKLYIKATRVIYPKPRLSFCARCKRRLYRLILRRAGFRVFCLIHRLLH